MTLITPCNISFTWNTHWLLLAVKFTLLQANVTHSNVRCNRGLRCNKNNKGVCNKISGQASQSEPVWSIRLTG